MPFKNNWGGIARREDFIIETKFGETINEDGSYGALNWSPDWVKQSAEISMKRMNISYIDLYAMHGGNPDVCTDKFIAALQDLKAQGIIRAYGVNTFDTDFLQWIAEEKCFDYVMLDYNIMRQDREAIIEKLRNAGIGVIAGSAMGESLYSKRIFRIKNRNDFWYLARALVRFRDLMNKSKDFKFLTQQDNYSANQLALRYVLDNSNVSSAVFSTINPEHLTENLRAVEIEMPEKIRKEIRKRA